MNKTYLGIIFAVIMLMSIGAGYAAVGVGSWVSNNGIALSITNGDSAEFRYGVNAVTIYGGKYSIHLYREGTSSPIYTYFSNVPTVDNGALGRVVVTPSQYNNLPGNYYVLIDSVDKYQTDSFRLNLEVVKKVDPLMISCDANPKSGTTPLNVAFTSTATGGSGSFTYSWTFGDGTTSTSQNTATHTYTTEGTYATKLTITDTQNNNNQVAVNCGANIVVTKPIIPITGTCVANPTSGTSPLNTIITVQANGGSGTYTYAWTFADGSTGGNYNSMSHTYATGTYNPTVKITDSNNNQATISCGTITANKPLDPLVVSCDANPKTGTTPLNVAFTSKVSGGTGTYSYKWTFADGTTSTSSQASHTYTTEGTYTTKLTITDSQNNQATANCGNVIVTKPIIPITGTCTPSTTSGYSPLNVQFTTTVSGGTGIYTYAWTLGDGYISAMDKTLTHVYDIPGTYNPTVKITDSNNNRITISCGTITANKPIAQLAATCSVTPTSGTAPLATVFKSQVTGGTGTYTYAWTFGDGAMGSRQNNTTHTYNNEGTYATKLTITDSQNNQATANCGNVVVTKPLAQLTGTCNVNPRTGTSPLDTVLAVQANGGTGTYTYFWTFGDGATGGNYNSMSHTYATGTYNPTVKITDSNNNQATISCGTITANKPITPISITCTADPKTGTTPLAVNFNSQVSGGTGTYTYAWTFADGSTSTNTQTASHTYNIEGTYTTKLTITDSQNNQATANCGNVIVTKPIETLRVSCDANPKSGTTPLNVAFTSTATGGSGIYTYKWTFADGTTSTNAKTASHTYNIEGTYTTKLTITDSQNNQATANCGNVIVTKPIAQLTGTCNVNPRTGTSPLDTVLAVQANGGTGIYTYSWTFGDGSTGGNYNSMSHTYATGTYNPTVKITDSNNNQATISCGTVTANKPLDPLVVSCDANPKSGTTPLNVAFTSTATGGSGIYTYKWTFADGTTSTNAKTASHTYNIEGTYTTKLTITDSQNNQATANCGNVVVTKPIAQLTGTCNVTPTSGTAPLATVFKSQVTGGTGTYTYAWTFGDGAMGSRQNNTTHTYNNEGTYTTKLTITDSQNNRITVNCGNIVVSKQILPISVTCTADPKTGTTPLAVNFDSQVSGGTGTYTYAWTFADGSTSTNAKTATHTYTTEGTYTTKLTITDSQNNQATANCAVITANKPITPLAATCNANPKSGTAPLNVAFTTQVSGGTGTYTYAWTFGDGGTSTSSQATHTYTTPNTYTPTVKITDSNNNQITVNCGCIKVDQAIPALSATCNPNPTSGITPVNTQFTSKAIGGKGPYTYAWTFGDGQTATALSTASTEIVYTKKYQTVGVYNPILTITDSMNNVATVSCGQIKVDEVPHIDLDVTCLTMPSSGVNPLTVALTMHVNNGEGPYTYELIHGDGSSQTLPNSVLNTNTLVNVYTNPGVYTPSVIVTDAKGNIGNANCGYVVVSQKNITYPVANAGGPYKGYINEPVTLDASKSTGDIVKYVWDFGDGISVETTTPTIDHTYANIKTYDVKLTVFNRDGYSSSDYTKAVIIERSNYQPKEERDVPDKGILIEHLIIYGDNGEILKTNDDMRVNIVLKNEWTSKLENVRIIVSIPELGIETRSTLFDMRKGATHSETLMLPLYDIEPGVYYVRISVDNDEGHDQVRRVKYREVIVR